MVYETFKSRDIKKKFLMNKNEIHCLTYKRGFRRQKNVVMAVSIFA